jgi:hypothetical protein
MATIDWGSVPSWVSGGITAVSVAIGAVSLTRAVGDSRGAAARRVWPICLKYSYGTGPGPHEATVVVHNGSEEPVFESSVRLLNWDWKSDRKIVTSTGSPPFNPARTPASLSCVPSLHLIPVPARGPLCRRLGSSSATGRDGGGDVIPMGRFTESGAQLKRCGGAPQADPEPR